MPEGIIRLLEELDFIVSSATTIVLVLTFVSLLIANLARYVQAKNYGIPLKMVHYAGIPDSLDIWITLISVLGFGLFVPGVILTIGTNIVTVLVVVFVSCFLGLTSTKASFIINKADIANGPRREINISWVFHLILTILVTSAVAYLFFTDRQSGFLTGFSIFRVVLYASIIIGSLVTSMYKKIIGNQDIMTVEIESQPHLIAMRHVLNYWILIPCTFGKARGKITVNIGKKENEDENEDMIDTIEFTKGKFIVRDVSLLEGTKNIHCRSKHILVGKKENAKPPPVEK